MEVSEIKAMLKREYGIENEEEFNEAISKCKGIDLGIFTENFKEDNEDVRILSQYTMSA